MEHFVFNNEFFDTCLTKKTEEILAKIDHQPITTEEMIILLLKAQTNHFDHLDEEFRKDIGILKIDVNDLKTEIKEVRSELKGDINSLRS